MAENTEKEIKVKSLQKALDILNCFTKKSTWGVTELSEYLDLNKSNVHSILSTFTAMEYLRQDEETGSTVWVWRFIHCVMHLEMNSL